MQTDYKYDPRPTVCPWCKGAVVYGDMQTFGIDPFQSGKCYICTNCGSFVGTHRKKPLEALGMLADRETRVLRKLCHEEFDKHWMSTPAKNRLYYKLSQDMGIKYDDCHFGYMNKEQLQQALDIMKNWGDLYFR